MATENNFVKAKKKQLIWFVYFYTQMRIGKPTLFNTNKI